MVRAPRSTPNKRSYLLQLQVRNLLSRTPVIGEDWLEKIGKGIANQWIKSIGVYGLDDKNRCHVGLQLTINWVVYTTHVLVVGDRVAEAVSTEDDLAPPEVVNAVAVFNQAVKAGNLRTEWYCRYEQGLDPAAINKELGFKTAPLPPWAGKVEQPKVLVPELPELQVTFRGFSPAQVPSEYLHALLQHLYAVDILTQYLQRSAMLLPISVMKEVYIEDHVRQLQQEGQWGERRPPQGIIYQLGSLPENYEDYAKQFVEALGNEQHRLRKPAEQLLQRFAAAAAKDAATDKGILIEQASRKFGIPARTLASWAEMELIPVLSRSKQAIYLDKEAVAEAAPLYREAKEQGVQPARLLKERRAQQAEREANELRG
jgi:hypothetical protein